MIYKFLKTAIFSISALALVVIPSCTKPLPARTDFTQTSDFVILTGAGTGNFKAANIQVNTTSTDTVKITITANLASANNNSGAVPVTIGVDAAQIATYNAANGTKYQPFPAGSFKIVNPVITIPAGQHYGTTTIQIYQNKLDPTVSYLLPISITDASGKQLSSNQNTIYYNIIGNPIAGNYYEDWRRWQSLDTSGAPFYHFSGDPNVFSPETPTQILVESVDNGADFHISFTNTNGVLSNFKVTLDPASWGNFGATAIVTAPILMKADPINGIYQIFYQYLVGANQRTVVELFTKF